MRIELVPRQVASEARAVIRPLAEELSWPGEIGQIEGEPLPMPLLTQPASPLLTQPASPLPERPAVRGFQYGSGLIFLFPGPVVALGEERVQGCRLTPSVAGRWWWRSPSILMFEPDLPLVPGTYWLRVPFKGELRVEVRERP